MGLLHNLYTYISDCFIIKTCNGNHGVFNNIINYSINNKKNGKEIVLKI